MKRQATTLNQKSDFRADLHCHSTCSDGSDTPAELLRKAKSIGLSGLSITDHDTINAYTPELFALANELSIRLLPGLEFSTEWNHHAIHLLGYNIDIHSEKLRVFLAEMIRRRDARNLEILDKLAKIGMPITVDELNAYDHRTLGRPHIALIMVAKKYVATPQDAFDHYLTDGAPCYAPGIKYTPKETVDLIHEAGGRAVIAHPQFIKSRPALDHLLTLPFDGIECYYGNMHQEKKWLTIAKQKGWIATGGSDYHGPIKPHIELGRSWVDLKTFDQLSG